MRRFATAGWPVAPRCRCPGWHASLIAFGDSSSVRVASNRAAGPTFAIGPFGEALPHGRDGRQPQFIAAERQPRVDFDRVAGAVTHATSPGDIKYSQGAILFRQNNKRRDKRDRSFPATSGRLTTTSGISPCPSVATPPGVRGARAGATSCANRHNVDLRRAPRAPSVR